MCFDCPFNTSADRSVRRQVNELLKSIDAVIEYKKKIDRIHLNRKQYDALFRSIKDPVMHTPMHRNRVRIEIAERC